jgi:hypothetical protein
MVSLSSDHQLMEIDMKRYILIDAASGFVWGDGWADNAVSCVAQLDSSLGAPERVYRESGHRPDGADGYHVFTASYGFPAIEDGQDDEMIRRIETECDLAGFVSYENQSNQ